MSRRPATPIPAAAALQAGGNGTAEDSIRKAFGSLRPISKAHAERMGFTDAATPNGIEPTHCLFGEPLSTHNRNQQVIGLAPTASAPGERYNANAHGELVFMDLAKLAEYLANTPKHPFNRAPLDASNIHNYAFRIE